MDNYDYEKLTIVDDEGNEVTYDIVLNFTFDEAGREYFVYTDHSEDEEGIVNLYVCCRLIDDEEGEYIPVDDEEELAMVEEVLAAFEEE